jgi:hypothetical protein
LDTRKDRLAVVNEFNVVESDESAVEADGKEQMQPGADLCSSHVLCIGENDRHLWRVGFADQTLQRPRLQRTDDDDVATVGAGCASETRCDCPQMGRVGAVDKNAQASHQLPSIGLGVDDN